jgi:hypothetical protein
MSKLVLAGLLSLFSFTFVEVVDRTEFNIDFMGGYVLWVETFKISKGISSINISKFQIIITNKYLMASKNCCSFQF